MSTELDEQVTEPSWLQRHREPVGLAARWAAAAGAVVLLVALVAQHDDYRFDSHTSGVRAQVGRTYGAFSSTDGSGGRAADLRLPNRSVRVEVTPGADSAYDEEGGGDNDIVRPPSGGQLVVLTFWFGAAAPTPALGSNYATSLSGVTVTLIADGHRYPVVEDQDSVLLSRSRLVVAVRGRPSRYGVALTLGGVTQTVELESGTRTSGAAEALYHPAKPVTRPCGAVTLTDGFQPVPGAVEPACAIQTQAVPWVAGKGWAPTGSTQLVVTVRFARPAVVQRTRSGTSTRYRILTRSLGATLVVDGHVAQSAGSSDSLGGTDVYTAFFVATVPAGKTPHEVTFSDSFTAQSIDGPGERESDAAVVRHVTI